MIAAIFYEMKNVEKKAKKLKLGIDFLKEMGYNNQRRRELCVCESGGTGRRARLRGVWFYHTGSSPVSRTNSH